MSHDFCMACGVLLPIHSPICPGCRFDNTVYQYPDMPGDSDFMPDTAVDEADLNDSVDELFSESV